MSDNIDILNLLKEKSSKFPSFEYGIKEKINFINKNVILGFAHNFDFCKCCGEMYSLYYSIKKNEFFLSCSKNRFESKEPCEFYKIKRDVPCDSSECILNNEYYKIVKAHDRRTIHAYIRFILALKGKVNISLNWRHNNLMQDILTQLTYGDEFLFILKMDSKLEMIADIRFKTLRNRLRYNRIFIILKLCKLWGKNKLFKNINNFMNHHFKKKLRIISYPFIWLISKKCNIKGEMKVQIKEIEQKMNNQ